MTKSFRRSQLVLSLTVAVLSCCLPTGAQNRGSGAAEIQMLPVQGNVYLLTGAGANICVQLGDQGVWLVDSGTAESSDKVLAAIRTLSKKPIRFMVNTGVDADHTAGNEKIGTAGINILGSLFQSNIGDTTSGARIIAHENAFRRMSGLMGGKALPFEALPMDNFPAELKKMYFNDEGIEIIHIASAHSDSDSMVFFRRSDVLSTGDIFSTVTYPVIDVEKGGSIQGIIDGLNRILQITIAKQEVEGGTYVIPGHGRVSDQFEVLEYRDMVTIIRDRVQAMIKKGSTLEQIEASRPTEDYDARYGTTRSWTPIMFVEAVYKSLVGKK